MKTEKQKSRKAKQQNTRHSPDNIAFLLF